MYLRKTKEIKSTLEENMKRLNTRKQENDLLKSEITDLNKILSLTEEEAKIRNNFKMEKLLNELERTYTTTIERLKDY